MRLEVRDTFRVSKRDALRTIGWATLSLAVLAPRGAAAANVSGSDGPLSSCHGRATLGELGSRLAVAPRRRSFDTVPFMLTDQQYWDHEAAAAVLAYSHPARQVWENTELAGPWPGLMREAMNGQVFSSGNADFLAVSATHGYAHLALFSQLMWDKYNLAALAGPKFARNTLILEKDRASPSDGVEDVAGFYGPANNNILSLQRRGAVFIACHDSIHAIARTLHSSATPPAGSADATAADLTNNLIPDAVLVPSVVAFLVDLQSRGFTYAKGS
jgi:intracellular sulfur oxidation DsrE/DsrF family protein